MTVEFGQLYIFTHSFKRKTSIFLTIEVITLGWCYFHYWHCLARPWVDAETLQFEELVEFIALLYTSKRVFSPLIFLVQGLANIDVFMQSTINTGWLKINLLPLSTFMLTFKIFDLFLRQPSQEDLWDYINVPKFLIGRVVVHFWGLSDTMKIIFIY